MKDPKEFEKENPELANYVKSQIQKAVETVCDIVISQYDSQIAASKLEIEKLKNDMRFFETDNWNSNTL